MSNSKPFDIQDSPIQCFNYWNKIAYSQPAAQGLAAEIGLEFNNPSKQIAGFKSGLEYPVRRLVVSGKDTLENFKIILGPSWSDGVSDIWKTCRKYVLMAPTPGSPAFISAQYVDEGCLVWRPRPANAEEEKEIRIQEEFTRKMIEAGVLWSWNCEGY